MRKQATILSWLYYSENCARYV